MRERKTEKLIQSYVYRDNGDCFFISTAYRSTSIDAAGGEVWYYETFAWEWDKDTKERGKWVADHSGATCEKWAFDQHFTVSRRLHDTGEFNEEE